MSAAKSSPLASWTHVVPVLGLITLVFSWERNLPGFAVGVVAIVLAGTVLVAVHHAEVVAHKVGEPFGSLVLAVSVTVIEVALIVTLMLSGKEGASTLARDTVFAAVMITCNGILGLSIMVASVKYKYSRFNAEGSGGALATVITLAVMCLVLPTFTTAAAGPQFSGAQLAFAGVASITLYGMFVFTQTIRHRDFFLPVDQRGETIALHDADTHADPPTTRRALTSLGLLLLSLICVVGLAKVESPAIEGAVRDFGLPHTFVGVIIALLVLAPETLAAVNNARLGRAQTSLNLAFGSAMASIGLTIPTLALLTIFIDVPLHLGLGSTQIALLVVTAMVAILTVVPGRATRLQGGVHLVLLASYVYLSAVP